MQGILKHRGKDPLRSGDEYLDGAKGKFPLGPVEPLDNEWRTAWGEDATLEVRTHLATRTLHTSARSSERWSDAEHAKDRCWRNCLSWSEGK